MSKCTFRSERALWHFPISANLSFKFLLKIILSSNDFPGFHRDDIEVWEPAYLVLFFVQTWVSVFGISAFICLIILVLIIVIVKIISSIYHWVHVHINIGHLPLTGIIDRACWTQFVVQLLLLLCAHCLLSWRNCGCGAIIHHHVDLIQI